MKKLRKLISIIPSPHILIGIFIICLLIVLGLFEVSYKNETIEQKFLIGIIVSICCSIMASMMYAVVQNMLEANVLDSIKDNLSRLNELHDSGIISIHPKGNFDNSDQYWRAILENTSNRLDLAGHSLSHWFQEPYADAFGKCIRGILERGGKVRLVMSGDKSLNMSNVFQASQKREKLGDGQKLEKTLVKIIDVLKRVEKDKLKNFELYYTGLSEVQYIYIRTDSQCIISPYFFSNSDAYNNFLLELKGDSAYTRAFDNDFRGIIENASPLNLGFDEKIKQDLSGIRVSILETENTYKGYGWNREKTTKYIFEIGFRSYEAGYFEHYYGNVFIKSVIELPVSYGCQSKCKFCASGSINVYHALDEEEIFKMFRYIYDSKNLQSNEYVLLTLTGMGDVCFNLPNAIGLIAKVREYTSKFNNVHLTISSSLWTSDKLSICESLNNLLPIRNIQCTYVTDNSTVLGQLVPYYQGKESNWKDVVQYINKSEHKWYRINYIMIKGSNDSDEAFESFINSLEQIKDKVVVRISKLNLTKSSAKNNLECAGDDRFVIFEGKLKDAGIKHYRFNSENNDFMSCGQLVSDREHFASRQ